MKSLKARLLTAVIGIASMLAILFLGSMYPIILGCAISLVTAFMCGEYLHANNMLKKYFISVPCILFSLIVPLISTTQFLYPAIVFFMLVSFSMLIFKHEKLCYRDFSYAISGIVLITFGMSALSALCLRGLAITFYFVSIFALPWMCDAGGFFVGATLGKHKLCPKISPKKTVEGAIGGVIFCIISAVIVWVLFQNIFMPQLKFNFFGLLILAVLNAVISIIGDLSFSLIKRSLDIKDYSSIFPGHGGMIDRFDSIIFTAPVMLAIDSFMPFVTMG